MKREFLESLDIGEGAKLPKSAIDAIMAENGKDIEAKNNAITTLTAARDGLQQQLDDATKEIKSYRDMDIDGIKQSAADWETKYNTETQALKDQLAAQEYGHSVSAAVAGIKFSSESAKKAFIADLTAKKLTLQDGKLLGLDDFVKDYKESDPGAFLGDNPPPQFTGPTGNGGAPSGLSRAAMAARNAGARFAPAPNNTGNPGNNQ